MRRNYSLYVDVPGKMNFHVHLATCIDHMYMYVTLSVETLCVDSVYAASPGRPSLLVYTLKHITHVYILH